MYFHTCVDSRSTHIAFGNANHHSQVHTIRERGDALPQLLCLRVPRPVAKSTFTGRVHGDTGTATREGERSRKLAGSKRRSRVAVQGCALEMLARTLWRALLRHARSYDMNPELRLLLHAPRDRQYDMIGGQWWALPEEPAQSTAASEIAALVVSRRLKHDTR